jgi:outer membrane protein assembly factor BamB
MKKAGFISCLAFTGFVLLTVGFSVNISENGWRGINRDGKVEGFIAPASWPVQLAQVWKTQVGLGDASPVLVNNKLYLPTKKDSSEYLLCIDATTGKILWEANNNKSPVITGGPSSHPGPRSTPYVTGGKVITIGAGGIVTCRNAETGKLIWQSDQYKEVPQFFVAVSPLVTGNKVIAHLNGKEKGVIIALDINSGSEIWKLEGISSSYSSPVLMKAFKNMVVVQAEKDLLGVSTDKGELLWKTPAPPESRFYNSTTPIVNGQNIIIAGQGSGARNLKITKEGDSFNVTEVWKNPEISVSFSTPVLKDGFIYGNESRLGYLFCLNAETGAKCWVDTVKYNRFASVLDLGNIMTSLPANGQLIFFKPDHQSFKQIARYKIAETEVYAHPVISGNKIYVKDKEFLTCWSL